MPPRKRYLSTLFLTLFFLCNKVHTYAQTSYKDFKEEQKKIILNEQFISNNNFWPLYDCKIEQGFLISEGIIFGLKTSLSIPIIKNKDYEIEISALGKGEQGLVAWNKYRWVFDEKISTLEFNNSQLKSFDAGIKKFEFHKFTIRKIGTEYYYFDNEKYLGNSEYEISGSQEKLDIGFAGKLTVDYLKVSYLSKEELITNPSPPLIPVRTNSATDGIQIQDKKKSGKYYGLIIGVSEYNDTRLKLDNPIKDAKKLKEILVKRYSFADSTIILVLNPTRQKILAELFKLRKTIRPDDNLLIFYAGHGYWDEDARQGYWWPKDVSTADLSNWLSNSDLREQVRSIKSAHTLLISDACFSGGIFKTRDGNEIMNATKDIQLLYKMPSRRAMTSGTMTTVPDKSVFLEYFLKRLTENQNKFLSSQQLFASLRSAVINNSNVVPQDGVIAETGDEGGDFIFILKEN